MFFGSTVMAAIKTETINYKAGDTNLKGFLAYDDSTTAKRPAIIVAPEWWGLTDYPQHRAQQLAELGYVAFAIDMYGDGKTTDDAKEAGAWAGDIHKNPQIATQRAGAALQALKNQPMVDADKIAAIGYCFGGVLSLLYGSIFSDGPMKNLICFTTPVDFREMKLFSNFSDRRYFDVDRLVDSVGNVPPEMIMSSFEMLRPASRAFSQVQLWDNIWNDDYVKSFRMFDRWATDTLPLAGEYFRAITKDLMWDNKLHDGTMTVGGRAADLANIKVPILHAVAEHDHIVPYESARHLIPKVGSEDKEEVMLKGGHVSLVAGANAIKRLWPKLDSWLGGRST